METNGRAKWIGEHWRIVVPISLFQQTVALHCKCTFFIGIYTELKRNDQKRQNKHSISQYKKKFFANLGIATEALTVEKLWSGKKIDEFSSVKEVRFLWRVHIFHSVGSLFYCKTDVFQCAVHRFRSEPKKWMKKNYIPFANNFINQLNIGKIVFSFIFILIGTLWKLHRMSIKCAFSWTEENKMQINALLGSIK